MLNIEKIFPILNSPNAEEQLQNTAIEENDFLEVVSTLISNKVASTFHYMIIDRVRQRLRQTVVPTFWSYFRRSQEHNGFIEFFNSVKYLYDRYVELDVIMTRLEMLRDRCHITEPVYGESCVHSALKLMLRASLLAQLPINYQVVVMDFYESALKTDDPNDSTASEGHCHICQQASDECNCHHLFYETNRKLGDMTLLEPLIGQVLTNLIYTYIQSHIQKLCKDNFNTSYLEVLERWLDAIVINWLKKVYCLGMQCASEVIQEFEKKLSKYLYHTYTKIRIDQLFNIIIEHPESLPALEDLRTCLVKTDLKPELTRKLQRAMETRLLHPGVSTPDILTAYVAAIRSLRVLDPSGLLLETVTQPVHQYLRSRDDTVRCIVSSLIEEGPSDLAEEFSKGEAVQLDENTDADEDTRHWELWVPDPIDVNTNKSSGSRRSLDIISMLVSVYGSKELFVNEYRTLLADRLLSQFSCDTEKELRYLELLKLRFGDSQLHFCEVMLKDVGDSKRINQHIRQDVEYHDFGIPLSVLIVSEQFWPPFKEDRLGLHDLVTDQMNCFTSSYKALKGSRTLDYKAYLGMVELEVELKDRTLSLTMSPTHATIIMHFCDEKPKRTLKELSDLMEITPTCLRRKMSYWQSLGVIVETDRDVFCLSEALDGTQTAPHQDLLPVEDYEAESAMASARDQREEELQTFWSYIVGMLTNLETLPLERIHQMLKMFAFQGPTIECTLQELKVFLERKVREHLLIYSNGLYCLPK